MYVKSYSTDNGLLNQNGMHGSGGLEKDLLAKIHNKPDFSDLLDYEEKEIALYGWTKKALTAWSNDDVFNWLFFTINNTATWMQTHSSQTMFDYSDCAKFKAENFQNVTGIDLANFTESDFIEKDKVYGYILFQSLKQLIHTDIKIEDNFLDQINDIDVFRDLELEPLDMTLQALLPSIYTFKKESPSPSLSSLCSPNNDVLCSYNQESTTWHELTGDYSSVNRFNFEADELLYPETATHFFYAPLEVPNPRFYPIEKEPENLSRVENIEIRKDKRRCTKNVNVSKERQVRQLKKYPVEDLIETNRKPIAKKSRTTHLWKFMMNLLDSPQYNPDCIRWEDEALRIFRIVPGKSKLIAKLWGLKKHNSTMNFDKLSRSLRWCRENGFLEAVPKNQGFPKKLCFKFGIRASE